MNIKCYLAFRIWVFVTLVFYSNNYVFKWFIDIKKDQTYTLTLEMLFALYTYIVANVSITVKSGGEESTTIKYQVWPPVPVNVWIKGRRFLTW